MPETNPAFMDLPKLPCGGGGLELVAAQADHGEARILCLEDDGDDLPLQALVAFSRVLGGFFSVAQGKGCGRIPGTPIDYSARNREPGTNPKKFT